MLGRDLHYRFLAAGLSNRFDEAAHYLADPYWQWEKLIDTASIELVLPLVQDLLRTTSAASAVPPDVSNLFATVQQLNADRNRNILSQVTTLTAALNAQGIEPVALKGLAHLVSGVYNDNAIRYLVDIDLLVSESDLPKAVKILADSGYQGDKPHPIELAIGHSYPSLARANSVPIDLHQSMGRRICNLILPPSEVLRDSSLFEFEGVRLRIPSPNHLVIHHIIHSQLHDSYRDRLWPPLRTMYDLVLLQRRFGDQIDWAAIETRFRAHRQFGILVIYLLRVENVLYFKAPIPLSLDLLTRLRWWRRRLLWNVPSLRLIDPIWFFSAGLSSRAYRMQEILRLPGGLRYLIRKSLTPGLLSRFRADVS